MADYQTLISADEIDERVQTLGREIRRTIGDDEIILVGVLRGSVIFMADLARAIDGRVRFEFLGVSSYEGTQSTGTVRITHDLSADIAGKHVVIVEDIVDTGLTLDFLIRTLGTRKPASLRTAALLDKPSRRTIDVPVEWIGFSIEDHFVIGYGLDFDQHYRNLPDVAIYKP